MPETGIKSRHDIEIETRRQFITEAARNLMTSREIEEITMDEIAVAAQYTRRTLYAYFKSRDEILLRIYSEDLRVRWSHQQKAIARATTGLDKLIKWARSLFEYAKENPQSMRLQYYWDYRGIDAKRVSEESMADLRIINDELADGLRAIFELGISDGSLRPELNVDLCISQFLYSLRAVINRAMSGSYSFASFEPDSYVEHFLDLFSRAIRAKGEFTA